MPRIRSESCSFIWHPNVVTWYRIRIRAVSRTSIMTAGAPAAIRRVVIAVTINGDGPQGIVHGAGFLSGRRRRYDAECMCCPWVASDNRNILPIHSASRGRPASATAGRPPPGVARQPNLGLRLLAERPIPLVEPTGERRLIGPMTTHPA